MNSHLTDRQHEILQEAMKIIVVSGVQGLTMRHVAMAMGFSEPALYRHFPGKLAMLTALLDLFKSRLQHLVHTYLQGRVTGIRDFFMELLAQLEQNPAWSAVIFSEEIFQNELELAIRVKGIIEEIEEAIIQHIRLLPQVRELPPKHVAWMFLGSVRFLVTRWRLQQFDFSLMDEGKPLLHSLCQLFHMNICQSTSSTKVRS